MANDSSRRRSFPWKPHGVEGLDAARLVPWDGLEVVPEINETNEINGKTMVYEPNMSQLPLVD